MIFSKEGNGSSGSVSRSTIGMLTVLTVIALLSICCIGLLCYTDPSDAVGETSGTCGEHLNWEYNTTTKTLAITYDGEGSGAMTDFSQTTRWGGWTSELTTVTIGDGVTSIGRYAFYGCRSLTSIEIPNTVTLINDYAFETCPALPSITIPENVETIGTQVFYECDSLTTITVDAGNDNYLSEDGILFTKDKSTLIQYPSSKAGGSYTLPNGTTTISMGAFRHTPLTSVVCPDVTAIGSNAFYECKSLVSVEFPKVVTIGNWAFYGCSSLRSVSIPSTITSIGNSVFSGCISLTSVTLPDKAMTMGTYTFSKCYSLTSVIIPNGVTSITDGTFHDCRKLSSVTIPNSVTSIGTSAFYNCVSLTEISIPDSVTSIDSFAFQKCAMLRTVTLGAPVSINSSTFNGCRSLQSIDIPASVESISYTAFTDCCSLNSINVDQNNTYYRSVNGVLFRGNELTVYPMGKTDESYRIPDGTISVGNYSFQNQEYLKTLELPDSFTTINQNAFDGCRCLKSITGNSVALIKNEAFKGCKSLETAAFGDALTTINAYAFYGCSSLRSITFGNALTTIGTYAFFECTSLGTITMGDNVTSIGTSAFQGCSSLDPLVLSESLTTIGMYAFQDCISLKSITIPKNVTSIGDRILGGCSSLTAIYVDDDNTTYSDDDGILFNKSQTQIIVYPVNKAGESYTVPDGVTTLGTRAFRNCSHLRTVNIPATVTSIPGDYTFSYATSLEAINVDPENPNYSSIDGVLYNKDKTRLISYPVAKSDKMFTIPVTVTTFPAYVFQYCNNLETVTLGSQITSINGYAFYGCTSLKTVNIQGNINNINSYTFYECPALETVVIPATVNRIYGYAFYRCTSLTSAEFNGSSVIIEDYAFYGCTSLTTLDLTKVSSIGDTIMAFAGCDSLTSFTVGESNEYFSAVDGVLFNKAKTWLLQYPAAKEGTSYTVPDTVTMIRGNAFRGCSHLTSLTMGKGVYNIGNSLQNTGTLASIMVDEKNENFSSRNGCLYDKSGVILLVCPSGMKSVTFDKDTLVADMYSMTGKTLEEIKFVSGQKTVLYTSAISDCGSLKKINVEDGADIVFDLDSIESKAKEKQTVQVVAGEGFTVPSYAASGNVEFEYIRPSPLGPEPGPEPEPSGPSGGNGNLVAYIAIGVVAAVAVAGAAVFLIRRRV